MDTMKKITKLIVILYRKKKKTQNWLHKKELVVYDACRGKNYKRKVRGERETLFNNAAATCQKM